MEEKFVRRGFFFETFWANSSGGFEGPETFFWICSPLFISPLFHLISSLLFSRSSLHMSCFFSCLFSSLLSHVSSHVLLLLCLCLSLSVSVLSRLSFSVSLCLCLCVNLSVLCGVCGVSVCTFKNASVCPSKTPLCVDSKRPRVYRHHARVCYQP